MAIRLLCTSGTLLIQSGPTKDMVEISSQTRDTLRRILGPDVVIGMSGRTYFVRIDRERLAGFLSDVFERYGV